eukprot:7379357-Prymnesium_polylepis.1
MPPIAAPIAAPPNAPAAIPTGPPTIPNASPASAPKAIDPAIVAPAPTAEAVTPPMAPPLMPPTASAASVDIPPRSNALVIARADSDPATYAPAPASTSGPRAALAPNALAAPTPIVPATAPSVASSATRFIRCSGSMTFIVACASTPATAPVAKLDVRGIIPRMTV